MNKDIIYSLKDIYINDEPVFKKGERYEILKRTLTHVIIGTYNNAVKVDLRDLQVDFITNPDDNFLYNGYEFNHKDGKFTAKNVNGEIEVINPEQYYCNSYKWEVYKRGRE